MIPFILVAWVLGMVVMYAFAGTVRGASANRTVVDAIEEALAIVLWPLVMPLALLLVLIYVLRGAT